MRFAEDTRYHRLAVVDDADSRYLRFDNSLQSAMYLNAPFRTRYRYTDLFHLGIAYNTGRTARALRRARRRAPRRSGCGATSRSVQIQAVELDPVVVDVAYRYFHLPARSAAARRRRGRAALSVGVAAPLRRDRDRRLLRRRDPGAPRHAGVPRASSGRGSTPGGVVVTNAIGAISGTGSRLFRSIYKTYRTAFPSVLVHPAILPGDRGDDQYRNLILVATEKAAPGRQQLADRWAEVRSRTPSRARPPEADPRPPRRRDPDRGRARADGRLRADGRAAAPLPVGCGDLEARRRRTSSSRDSPGSGPSSDASRADSPAGRCGRPPARPCAISSAADDAVGGDEAERPRGLVVAAAGDDHRAEAVERRPARLPVGVGQQRVAARGRRGRRRARAHPWPRPARRRRARAPARPSRRAVEERAVRVLRPVREVPRQPVQDDRGAAVRDREGVAPEPQREPERDRRDRDRVQALARGVVVLPRHADHDRVERPLERAAERRAIPRRSASACATDGGPANAAVAVSSRPSPWRIRRRTAAGSSENRRSGDADERARSPPRPRRGSRGSRPSRRGGLSASEAPITGSRAASARSSASPSCQPRDGRRLEQRVRARAARTSPARRRRAAPRRRRGARSRPP